MPAPNEIKIPGGYTVCEDTGVSVAAGVVCKCDEPGCTFCPRHGRRPALAPLSDGTGDDDDGWEVDYRVIPRR